VAFLGAIRLGVIPVLVNSMLSASELRSVVEQAQPRLVFTEAARADAVRELRGAGLFKDVVCAGDAAPGEIPFAALLKHSGSDVKTADTAADEPAFIVYTSGPPANPRASCTRTAGSLPSVI
jgi:benzoate-CoA ligase